MSFAEILVIAVVALVIVGPERLPDAIRTGMLWFGRIKRTINETKTEFENQLGVDEIRRELHNEQVMKSLKALEETQEAAKEKADEFESYLQQEVKRIEDSIDDPVHHDIDPNADSNEGIDQVEKPPRDQQHEHQDTLPSPHSNP